MIEVVLAVPELPQEADLVAGSGGAGLRVVRRCVDAADLLAAATADPSAAVVVSAGLPRLSADAVERLRRPEGRRVAGLAADAASVERLRGLGVPDVGLTGPTAAATLQHLAQMLSGTGPGHGRTGVWSTGCWPGADADAPVKATAAAGPARVGFLVAVWGPMGAPGRTTVAIGVAEALADTGLSVCLVDADTYAPSIAMTLGIVDEAGGLLVACRHADAGSLTDRTLLASVRRLPRGVQVLTGLAAAQGWRDLRSGALDRVWETCRSVFDVTVVDVGFCLEDDDDAWSRRRNAAALSAIAVADRVLVVADATPAGAARLLAGLPQLPPLGVPLTIVRNRAAGRDREWESALRACGVDAPVVAVPYDPKALQDCWRRGRSLGEGARRSRIRRALVDLAAYVLPRGAIGTR